MSNIAGYIEGNSEVYLDHLAPLCSLMEWPLILTDEELYAQASRFYPDLNLSLKGILTAPFEVTKEFDIIVTALPRIAFDEIFFVAEATMGKRLKTIWLPHGNSDKGHLLPWMELLSAEQAAFVYGPRMIDFFALKNVKIPTIIPIGNFRYVYFQRHRQFYENLLDQMGLPNSFVLYAPSWKDGENSGSLETAVDDLMKNLEGLPLVIKPHPNESDDIGVIQRKLSSQIHWLDHFTPVYPLLNRTSHYIGDFSSVGYDFLQFNRPMFFFNPTEREAIDPGRFLHHYGTTISKEQLPQLAAYLNAPSTPSEKGEKSEKIYELVRYTFGDESSWIGLLENVKQIYN